MTVHTDVEITSSTMRRLALAGVVGPILSVAVFTVAGVYRPGYSPVHQAISALGRGPGGWLVDAVGVVTGVGLIVFAVTFAVLMRPVLRSGVRWFAAACIALDGLGVATAAVFTAGPGTVLLHTIGSTLGAVTVLIALVVVGIPLRRDDRWRRWGSYTLVVAAVSILLIAVEYLFLMPVSPLHGLHVGGLLERADFIWHYSWYVGFGLKLSCGTPGFRRLPRA